MNNDIRQQYLDFFKEKGHGILPSASLLPENDPTTLFTGSGMQPMVPYLLGEAHPSGTRITDSQKCFRAQDIEEVGDNRHTTFFEMLGNWSLGDYFKEEQIPWMFSFLTETIGLDPKNLYITCFRGNDELGLPKDTESAEMWQKLYKEKGIDAPIADNAEEKGMQNARIFYYDEKKNWWSRAGIPQNMPAGEPGGPDTEMFWDFAPEEESDSVGDGLHATSEWSHLPCHVNCDCGRFMEIGNNVFMEYKKTENGFEKLANQNVDFGGGLERIAAAQIGNPDVFKISLFDSARSVLEQISNKTYGEDDTQTYAFRVVLDHIRAATFLISDNAYPSNKDQGYFTRRLIRRAVRFAQKLGIEGVFAGQVARAFIETYKDAYPQLVERGEKILEELEKEEHKFAKSLVKGMKKFEELAASTKEGETLSGELVFDLYQSYGFPIEITEEVAVERGFKVDVEAFKAERQKHQNISRAGAEQKFKGGLADHSEMSVKYHTATHLLHAATIKVLGEHATQKGSNITPKRLRFDFSHPEKLTPEQKSEIEGLVNAAIKNNYPVTFSMMSVDEAREKNAIGLFDENYKEQVKVYVVGNPEHIADATPEAETFSREFCGGPHVEYTGTLGTFKITKEESVGAGTRRIKAILE